MTWRVAGVLIVFTLFAAFMATGAVGAPPKAPAPAGPRFEPAPGSKTDPATGLPTRVVHKASGIVLVLVPAGEFEMGSPASEGGRPKERQHRRVVRRPFYLGQTEVTVGQFRAFADASGYKTDAERGTPDHDNVGPGSFASTDDGERTWSAAANWRNPFPILKEFRPRDDHPVVHVTWNDAVRFSEHHGLRLPTEAEWEYAARAGGKERFPWGRDEAGGKGFANVADESRRRRFPSTNVYFPFDDGAALPAPAGRSAPNAWGLHDMIGNVEEWCQDAYGPYPADGADESAAAPPPGAGDKPVVRVLRGGSWVSNATNARPAGRVGMGQSSRRDFEGFRVAASADAGR